MVSSALWMVVQVLVLTYEAGSGQAWLGEGEQCGGSIAGRCEADLTCMAAEDKEQNGPVFGVCSKALAPGCEPCSTVQCPPVQWVCPGGHVTDPCGCCQHCARQMGEVCGGPSWSWGYCESGLNCALIVGLQPVRPPQTGVCKVLPGRVSDAWADPQCPWVWGCNVHAGVCDCYSLQTCHSAFSYNSLQRCLTALRGDELYLSRLKGGEEEEEECVEWGCQLQGHRCVCESHTPLLSEDACCATLKKVLCNNVTCPQVRTQSCPADSFLTRSFTPPGHCCPLVAAQCTCNFQLCSPEPTSCPEDTWPQLVAKGDGHPGTCCRRYECVREED